MSRIEIERSTLKEKAFKGAEILAIGFTLLGALVFSGNLIQGDHGEASQYAGPTIVWALIAGGLIAAERRIKSSEKN